MRLLAFALLLTGCSEYEIVGPDGEGAFPFEDGPNLVVDDDVALALVYAHTSTGLYEVDPETGETDFQGNFHNASGDVPGFVDIAIDLEGRLYGGTFERLYTIEPRTGRITPVCSLDFEPYAMTFGPNGVLYAGGLDRLVEVNTTSCATTVLVEGGFVTAGDIVGLPDGYLYWTVRGTTNDELVRVDPETGDAVLIGTIGAEGLYGVGYSDGQLYGFSSDGEIVAIDPSDASSTILDVSESISWWGATTNPVRW